MLASTPYLALFDSFCPSPKDGNERFKNVSVGVSHFSIFILIPVLIFAYHRWPSSGRLIGVRRGTLVYIGSSKEEEEEEPKDETDARDDKPEEAEDGDDEGDKRDAESVVDVEGENLYINILKCTFSIINSFGRGTEVDNIYKRKFITLHTFPLLHIHTYI